MSRNGGYGSRSASLLRTCLFFLVSRVITSNNASVIVRISVGLIALDYNGLLASIHFAKQLNPACLQSVLIFAEESFLASYRLSYSDNSLQEMSYIKIVSDYRVKNLPLAQDLSYDRVASNHSTPTNDGHVSNIINAWQYILSSFYSPGDTIPKYDWNSQEYRYLLLAFKSSHIALPTLSFYEVFNAFNSSSSQATSEHRVADLVLLHKTQRLTTVSDWHDLSVVAFRVNSVVRDWLETFADIYYKYSRYRRYFTLFDPRPMILESISRFQGQLNVSYFSLRDVCSTTAMLDLKHEIKSYRSENSSSLSCFSSDAMSKSSDHEPVSQLIGNSSRHAQRLAPHPFLLSRCHHLSINNLHRDPSSRSEVVHLSSLELYCGQYKEPSYLDKVAHFLDGAATVNATGDHRYDSNCLLLNQILSQQRKVASLTDTSFPPTLAVKLGLGEETMAQNPIAGMYRGALRFRTVNNIEEGDSDKSQENNSRKVPKPFCWEQG